MLNYNRLLKSLSAADYRQLSPLLQFVTMPRGLILNPAGGNEAYLYFPTTSTVSLLNVMNDGEVWEGAVIGNDGLVGISLLAQATPRGRLLKCRVPVAAIVLTRRCSGQEGVGDSAQGSR
jgi:hypothetical protein